MSKQIQEMFGAIAPKYDLINRLMSFSMDRRWRNIALRALEGRQYSHILDLCAGTLDLSKRLAQLYAESKIMAVDFSLPMLEYGQKKISHHHNIQILCGDGHHIPLSNNSVDAVVCAFGIRNLENRPLAAEEVKRILTKKGRLVVLEFFRPQKLISKLFYRTYGRFLIPRFGGFISKQRNAYQYLQNSILDFFSVEEYMQFLKEHGFKNITSKSLSGGIVYRVSADT